MPQDATGDAHNGRHMLLQFCSMFGVEDRRTVRHGGKGVVVGPNGYRLHAVRVTVFERDDAAL